jgi:methionyl-tRNA synthetase
MARQFREVWDALEISYDEFVQTSEERHHRCARTFIQKVYDNGYIRKDKFEGWYCNGCESFKTEQEVKEANGLCPLHPGTPLIRRSEECYFFEQSKFRDRLLKLYEEHPDFIQPESRRNEIIALVKEGLQDLNITRTGEAWGIRVPWDERFTIYVWFDALLTYITGIGYGTDEAEFRKWWPADIHFIGKDITRFHCATWPAMLLAAGLEPPKMVFGHGFVYRKNEATGEWFKEKKTGGGAIEPMDIIKEFSAEAFRYYFLRQCPYPGDGEFSWSLFRDTYNNDLANKLGNLLSRQIKLVFDNYAGKLEGTAGKTPEPIDASIDLKTLIQQIQGYIEACQYNQALEKIWLQLVYPANQYADRMEPWKLVKSDRDAARKVLFALAEQLRIIAIVLKPFLPATAETLYRGFNYPQPWESVRFQDAWQRPPHPEDLVLKAQLDEGKVKPLFPRIK